MNDRLHKTADEPNGSFDHQDESSQSDPLVQAVDEFLLAVDSGDPVDVEAFVERYPAIAVPLRECLEALEFVAGVAPQTRECMGGSRDGRDCLIPLQAVGDFRIIREVGRGGMGIVYEAEQLSIGRKVALKVLPFAAFLDLKSLSRFKHEAQAAGSLKHPNIIGVHAVGIERGIHYYAMELVEGSNLSRVIAARRAHHPEQHPGVSHDDTTPLAKLSTKASLSSAQFFRHVARLGVQAADALEHAHRHGIVHRDIKPSNLMIDVNGHLWVMDFGLALIESDASHLTMTGDLLGTLRYMSPEQAHGDRRILDHRTDIYALGATLYELLTGRPAFDGDNRAKLLRDIAEREPASLRQVNSRIPVDLETIVLTAMRKEPSGRYATSGELSADLQRYLDNEPILARRLSLPARATRWCRGNQVVASLLFCLSLAICVTLYIIADAQRATPQAITASGPEVSLRFVHRGQDEINGNVSPDGSRLAYPNWSSGNIALFDLRTGARQDLTTQGSWTEPNQYGEEVVWSHDRKRLAYNWYREGRENSAQLRVITLDDLTEQVAFETTDWTTIWPLSWSGDGRQVLVNLWNGKADAAALAAVDVSRRSLDILKAFEPPLPQYARLSPDGKFTVYMRQPTLDATQHDLDVIEIGSEKSWGLVKHPANDRRPYWTPDGRWIVFLSDRGAGTGLWALRIEDGRAVGEPRLICGRMDHVLPRGFDKLGSFYYLSAQSLSNAYTAAIDVDNGAVTSPPPQACQPV